MKIKPPCPDCKDRGVVFNAAGEPVVCHCGATGERTVAKRKTAAVDSQAPRYFRGAKLRNT